MSSSTDPIEWFRYPFVATDALAKAWLTTEMLLGLAPNTLDAYARGLDDFLGFCQKVSISPATATRADLAYLSQPGTVDVLGDLALPLTGYSGNGGQR